LHSEALPDSQGCSEAIATCFPIPDPLALGTEHLQDKMATTAGAWYLGVDISTTALSATLLHYPTQQLYPLSWISADQQASSTAVRQIRAIAYLSSEELQSDPQRPTVIGQQAIGLDTALLPSSHQLVGGLLLQHATPYLNLGIPYFSEKSKTWEPQIQWSDSQTLPLVWIQQMMVALLSTLHGSQPNEPIVCKTEDLATDALNTALRQLSGVILGCPHGCSDAYRFNLREAVLAADLVAKPEQIFFLEGAIATLLAELPIPTASDQATSVFQPWSPARHNHTTKWQGDTLVVNVGATSTELLLGTVPTERSRLSHDDVLVRHIPYGGDAMDQDIICQLLYPSMPEPNTLGLHRLDLPLPGAIDRPVRYRLQQRLQSSPLGQNLLTATRRLKTALYSQNSISLHLYDQLWTINQNEFHHRVVLPYLQRLNRELNTLLSQVGIVPQAVQQIICADGTHQLPALIYWLSQKFQGATILPTQNSTQQHSASCGLALLPLYPHLLDAPQHQYGEYFLLREMLRLLPTQPLTLGRILQQLENQGINTRSCHRSILAILEGQLPAGLIPSETDAVLLTPASGQQTRARSLQTTQLFSRHGNQVYEMNADLRDRLWHYLSEVLSNTYQLLDEPLAIDMGGRQI